ncbi:MAG: tagaturonate reductase, partial [Clostridia bacterium]|nr:tagaturonate reductase [Clostridia bacterium]
IGLLYGLNTVKEAVEDETVGQLIQSGLYDEIIPTLDLPESELKAFAKDVLDRFRNPYIKHYLKSIALNSTSKFETRVLPSILEYKSRLGRLPVKLVFALAGLFALYRERNNIAMADNEEIIQMYDKAWKACGSSKEDYFKMVEKLLGQEQVWKTNLNRVEGLTEQVADYLYLIETEGMNKAVQTIL